MAIHILYLIFLNLFLPFLAVAQQTINGSVPVGAFLIAARNVRPWLSPSGDFAIGFQQVQGEDHLLFSIWYDKIPEKTIIWYPQTVPVVPGGSKVELTAERGLVLTDPQGRELWTSEHVSGPVARGVINDTGNFVLVGNDSDELWESFKFPTDTMLPTQFMERGQQVIYSKMNGGNFSRGRFQWRLLEDGNLVLNARDIPSNSSYDAYYTSDTSDSSNPLNSGERLIFNATGSMFILKRNGQRSYIFPNEAVPLGDNYHRVTLDFDGVLTRYYRPKNSAGNTSWSVLWVQPENICESIRSKGGGVCGLNNICSLGDDKHPDCDCPQGFSLLDPSDPYGDCKPNFTPVCDEGELSGDLFDFVELRDIDWPDCDYVTMNQTTEQDCRNVCLRDCFCAVAVYRDNSCWKKKFPLTNGYKGRMANHKVFVKYRKGDIPPRSPSDFPGTKKDRKSLIILGSALFGSSVFVNFVLIGVICLGFFLIYRKKPRNLDPGSNTIETNLLHFTYQELVEATNGFKEELGKGAFGIVYKGVMRTNTVAVKKLARVVQDGDKEFKAEVNAIARTHHKNLMRLLGFCDDAEHRLLVYEYMSNGTLASFLFENSKPNWEQRRRIALGIAKGISYLHEECTTQIIHCDIKPQNILLDDYRNARISDFGLAKLLMMNQSRTSTGIRGTKGYVAPEWFRNTPITAKVDVYSFGVLLLEIVSCRRSVGDLAGDEHRAILTDWAWDCYQEGNLGEFVENDFEALDDHKKLGIFVMVGLWCIQEDPSLRPTMRKVIQMLEGVVEVSAPPCPSPFSVTLISKN